MVQNIVTSLMNSPLQQYSMYTQMSLFPSILDPVYKIVDLVYKVVARVYKIVKLVNKVVNLVNQFLNSLFLLV